MRFSKNDGIASGSAATAASGAPTTAAATFENLNANLEITQFYDIALDPADPDRIYGGAQDNSSSLRDDDQLWNVTAVTGDGFMNAVDAKNANRVFQTSYPVGGASLILSTVARRAGHVPARSATTARTSATRSHGSRRS